MTFDSNEQCRASEKLLDASTTRLDCQSADLFSVNKYADRCSRRCLFKGGALSALAASLHVSPAQADDITSTSQEVLLRLRSIPTFCLVNPDGVPFMIFDGQASATGYFFLSFDVAAQALKDAREKDKNAGATEIWSNAKIIVVPLAVALQLALRKTQREAVNNGIKFNTFNDIVASVEGVEAAKEIERGNKDKWSQKGRVPLFHIEGLKLDDGREPRYFNRLDLLFEWRRQHPNDVAPPIQVSELVELYRNALGKNDLSRVTNLVIVPVKETNRVASQLMKSSTDAPLPTYNFKKAYLVGSAKG
eukprot:scaffold8240_cov133-Cylindrotheca_fusiformis.AAC.1